MELHWNSYLRSVHISVAELAISFLWALDYLPICSIAKQKFHSHFFYEAVQKYSHFMIISSFERALRQIRTVTISQIYSTNKIWRCFFVLFISFRNRFIDTKEENERKKRRIWAQNTSMWWINNNSQVNTLLKYLQKNYRNNDTFQYLSWNPLSWFGVLAVKSSQNVLVILTCVRCP